MRLSFRRAASVALLATLAFPVPACGWSFAPGLSCTRGGLFAAPPVVVRRANGDFLTWTQGDYPFFYLPRYEARDGRLLIVVQASSSSGSLGGRLRELRIEGAENVAALERGGAFFWEADPPRLLRLQVLRADKNAKGP